MEKCKKIRKDVYFNQTHRTVSVSLFGFGCNPTNSSHSRFKTLPSGVHSPKVTAETLWQGGDTVTSFSSLSAAVAFQEKSTPFSPAQFNTIYDP